MTTKLMAAMDSNNCIGINGQMPWQNKEEMRHFKRTTENHIVVMGRKTYESIGSESLKNRINVVLSETLEQPLGDVLLFRDMLELKAGLDKLLDTYVNKTIYVIGGAELYKSFMPLADEMILSCMYLEVSGGDTFFPPFTSGDFHLDSVEKHKDFEVQTWVR